MNLITTSTRSFPSFWLPRPLFALFSTSSAVFENSYMVAGQTLTMTQVKQVPAVNRTIQHWAVLVDWDLHRQRPYVVVDPYDPQGLLYLSRTEYLSQLKVWASNDLSVLVIARPGSVKPDPVSTDASSASQADPSQNSPPFGAYFDQKRSPFSRGPLGDRSSRLSWKAFLDLRKYVLRNVSKKEGMVSESAESIARTVYLWGRELLHYAEVKNPGRRLSVFTPLVKHLQTLLRHNGSLYTVKRLKIYLFTLYSYVLGSPLATTEPLGIRVRLSNGLPSFLSAQVRAEIRRGDLAIIRVFASIFNIYKAMRADCPPADYSAIVAPHPQFEKDPMFVAFQHFCKDIFPTLVKEQYAKRMGKPLPLFEYESGVGLLVRSAGANLSAPSILSMILDAQAWAAREDNPILDWFQLHKDISAKLLVRSLAYETHFDDTATLQCPWTFRPTMVNRLPEHLEPGANPLDQTLIPWVPNKDLRGGRIGTTFALYVGGTNRVSWKTEPEEGPPSPILGRLHNIEEAAGKVRTVAICDYWTQVAMKPIHLRLFDILKGLASNDATFDQTKTVDEYFQKGYKPHWSYDLKAATDTIPLALYKEVLTPFLRSAGEKEENARERVNLWAKILTDRDWQTPEGKFVRYGTGQPMGALSSWASLALTHHALVQFSNWVSERIPSEQLEPRPWFQPYLVLGDDVDISQSKAVADSYVAVCDAFRIKIGLAKSLHSEKNGFEFANQRFCELGNISPVSLKEELSALSWNGRMEFANRLLARFGSKSRDEVAGFLRKVTTAPQWEALIPELTGTRSEHMVRFVKYCLLNPFYLALRGKLELNIDSLVNWISLLSQDIKRHPTFESQNDRNRLEHALIVKMEASVKARWKVLMARIPFTWEYQPRSIDWGETHLDQVGIPLNDNALELKNLSFILPTGGSRWDPETKSWSEVSSKDLESYKGSIRNKLRVPPRATNAFMYLLYCVDEHNKMVAKRLNSLYDSRIQEAIGLKPLSHLTMRKGFKYSELLLKWVEIWAELESVPKAIQLNLNDAKASLLPETLSSEDRRGPKLPSQGTKPNTQELAERIYGPMREVCVEFARLTGFVCPGLPFFSDGMRGKAWTRQLRDAIMEYLETLAKRDSSPCFWPEAGNGFLIPYKGPSELESLIGVLRATNRLGAGKSER